MIDRETRNYWLSLVCASLALVAAVIVAGSYIGGGLESVPPMPSTTPHVVTVASKRLLAQP